MDSSRVPPRVHAHTGTRGRGVRLLTRVMRVRVCTRVCERACIVKQSRVAGLQRPRDERCITLHGSLAYGVSRGEAEGPVAVVAEKRRKRTSAPALGLSLPLSPAAAGGDRFVFVVDSAVLSCLLARVRVASELGARSQ